MDAKARRDDGWREIGRLLGFVALAVLAFFVFVRNASTVERPPIHPRGNVVLYNY